jgi:hypothetical protein
MLLPKVISALLSSSSSSAPPPSPCCAYNGNGAAMLHGIISISNIKGYPEPIVLDAWAGGDGISYNAVLINGTTPDTAAAGWIISNNATHQTFTVFNSQCHSSSTPLSSKWVDSFGFCGGSGNFVSPIGGYSNPLPSYIWATNMRENPSFMSFTTKEDACAPQFLISTASPLSGGSVSISFIGGSSDVPPQSWKVPPSYCM